jgi:hypothetical protein
VLDLSFEECEFKRLAAFEIRPRAQMAVRHSRCCRRGRSSDCSNVTRQQIVYAHRPNSDADEHWKSDHRDYTPMICINMKTIFLFAICSCAWAQIDRPQIGKMLDSTGAVRTVYGIASSVTLGEAETSGVFSSACSQTMCLVKTDASILWSGGNVDAPPGAALFAFDSDTAWIWFTESRQLARWRSNLLTPVDSGIEGRVLSIGASNGSVQFAVRRMNGVWIVNQDGSVAGSLPRETGPVMLIEGGVVYATASELIIRERRFPLEHVSRFIQMSGNYLEVQAGGVNYALRIEEGREALFQLPGAAQ